MLGSQSSQHVTLLLFGRQPREPGSKLWMRFFQAAASGSLARGTGSQTSHDGVALGWGSCLWTVWVAPSLSQLSLLWTHSLEGAQISASNPTTGCLHLLVLLNVLWPNKHILLCPPSKCSMTHSSHPCRRMIKKSLSYEFKAVCISKNLPDA